MSITIDIDLDDIEDQISDYELAVVVKTRIAYQERGNTQSRLKGLLMKNKIKTGEGTPFFVAQNLIDELKAKACLEAMSKYSIEELERRLA